MASLTDSWLMGLTILAATLAVSASQDGAITNATRRNLPEDDFKTTASLPFFPEIFAPASTAVANQLCRNDSLLFLESLRNGTLWAMEMFDSSTKFPSGIFAGVRDNLGNYGECLSVKANVLDNDSPQMRIRGKYCLVTLEIHPSKLPAPTNAAWARVKHSVGTLSEPAMNSLNWAMCIPSSCSADDLKSHLKYVLPKLDQLKSVGIPGDLVDVVIYDNMCSTTEDNTGFTAGQTALVCVIAFLLSSICLGSLVDAKRVNLIPKGYATEVLQCFALQRNLKKLFSCYKSDPVLGPISGVKFLTMSIIIFGHRFLVVSLQASDNPRFSSEKYDDVDFAIILDGMLLVDTFFFITGFLLCYYCIHESGKIKNVWTIPYLYFRRYIRLTPVYMFIVAFYSTLFVKLGSGPIWNHMVFGERERCMENWWINALYLNNILRVERMCYRVSWYLSADMQIFILAVPLVYLLIKFPKIGKIILCIVTATSLIIPFAVVYHHQLEPIMLSYTRNTDDFGAYGTFNSVYIPSYMRSTPYFVGIFFGYFIQYFNNNNMKLSQIQANCITVTAFILGLLPILSSSFFYQKNYQYNALVAATYNSFQRLSWALAIALGILVFNAGKEWYIMKFLSWKIFVPLSKLTYSAYLLHAIPQSYEWFSFKTVGHISWYNMIHLTLGDVVLAFLLSFVVSMAIEAPWMNLEKLIFSDNIASSSSRGKSEMSPPCEQKTILMKNIANPT